MRITQLTKAAGVLFLAAIAGAQPREWMTGTVVSVDVIDEQTGATVDSRGVSIDKIQRVNVTVRHKNREFTLQQVSSLSSLLRWLTRNPIPEPGTDVNVGESIRFAVAGAKGWILDGKKARGCRVVSQRLLEIPAAPVRAPDPIERPTILREGKL